MTQRRYQLRTARRAVARARWLTLAKPVAPDKMQLPGGEHPAY